MPQTRQYEPVSFYKMSVCVYVCVLNNNNNKKLYVYIYRLIIIIFISIINGRCGILYDSVSRYVGQIHYAVSYIAMYSLLCACIPIPLAHELCMYVVQQQPTCRLYVVYTIYTQYTVWYGD